MANALNTVLPGNEWPKHSIDRVLQLYGTQCETYSMKSRTRLDSVASRADRIASQIVPREKFECSMQYFLFGWYSFCDYFFVFIM